MTQAHIGPLAPPASDAEFARRIYLDLTGMVPSSAELAAFVADASADKRTKLIDKLLASPRYVAGRYRGEFGPCALHSISAGTFHQYRVTCRTSAADQRESRWSRDRLLLDGILHQDRTGWRELGE